MTNKNISLKKLKFKFVASSLLIIFLFVLSLTTFIYGYNLTQEPILAVLLFHDVVENPKVPYEITQKKLEEYIDKLLALKYKPVDPNNFENLLFKGFKGKNFMVTFDDGTDSEYFAIEKLYKKYGIKSVLFLVEDFMPRPENLSQEDIKKLRAECGTYLGLHGKHHIRYPEQIKRNKDFAKFTEETRVRLGNIFGCNITWVSYPFGDYNPNIINELKEKTALNLAFTIESGLITPETNKMEINRYMYLGGLEPNQDDLKLSLALMPPENHSNGQLLITLSVMAFFFLISRLFLIWKYYKALSILKIKPEDSKEKK